MDIKELKKAIREALAPNVKSSSKVAGNLAVAGESVVDTIHDDVKVFFDKYPDTSPFSIAIAESLVWAFYAKREDEFYKLAIDYLDKSDESIFDKLEDFQHRYEIEKTETILKSWKQVFDSQNLKQLPRDYTIDNLLAYQEKLIQLIGKYPLIGTWTTLSPFKALICFKPRQYKDEKLNELLMPLGSQVIKGIDFLRRLGFSVPMIEQEDESNIGTVFVAQKFQIDLAKQANSNVLFINSGLYRLGKNKED